MSSPYFTPCNPKCNKYDITTAHNCSYDKKQKYLALKEKIRTENHEKLVLDKYQIETVPGSGKRRSNSKWLEKQKQRKY